MQILAVSDLHDTLEQFDRVVIDTGAGTAWVSPAGVEEHTFG